MKLFAILVDIFLKQLIIIHYSKKKKSKAQWEWYTFRVRNIYVTTKKRRKHLQSLCLQITNFHSIFFAFPLWEEDGR